MSQPILEFYAGPGAGKSTISAYVFSILKMKGYNVELVREYAKDVVWRYGFVPPEITQEMIQREQISRQTDLIGKVDLIITDSPISLSLAYGGNSDLIDEENKKFDRYKFFVKRFKEYSPHGRSQTYEEAIKLDEIVKSQIDGVYTTIPGTKNGGDMISFIAEEIISKKLAK